ncbi:MAG: hypothetical protein CMJ31_04120 [Phycisphaerae bacterium]|nr:hypothetical protein [Phycisphaerae bacterium]
MRITLRSSTGLFLLACTIMDAGASAMGHTALHPRMGHLTLLGPVLPRCERAVHALMRGLLDHGADAALRSGQGQARHLVLKVVKAVFSQGQASRPGSRWRQAKSDMFRPGGRGLAYR